jgi:glycosyltransferase involved in cell wall biosynthesis
MIDNQVLVISTFAPDEPIEELFVAASHLPDLNFVFTGNPHHYQARANKITKNVYFTGFLADYDYWVKLRESAVLIDLSLMNDCLVCGAYEGLALGKAMVLSANPATERIFGDVAVLVDGTARSISNGCKKALQNRVSLQSNSIRIAETYQNEWRERADAARHAIFTLVS